MRKWAWLALVRGKVRAFLTFHTCVHRWLSNSYHLRPYAEDPRLQRIIEFIRHPNSLCSSAEIRPLATMGSLPWRTHYPSLCFLLCCYDIKAKIVKTDNKKKAKQSGRLPCHHVAVPRATNEAAIRKLPRKPARMGLGVTLLHRSVCFGHDHLDDEFRCELRRGVRASHTFNARPSVPRCAGYVFVVN